MKMPEKIEDSIMAEGKIIKLYLLIVFSIVIPVCGIVLLLNLLGVAVQSSVLGFVFIAAGGISTAFSGAIVSKKCGKIGNYFTLFKNFFNLKQVPAHYLMVLLFFLLVFGANIFNGKLANGLYWFSVPMLFAKAILFGGIEEIGWRYLFQPTLEKKLSFAVSSIITFCAWGAWHMMYNVVDGTYLQMDWQKTFGFFMGLLGTSFVLGCLYHVTQSLWLCVLYHALFNAFSQSFVSFSATPVLGIIVLILSVCLSIFIVAHTDKKRINLN